MGDRPPGPALLALARDVLIDELLPLLPHERRLDTLLIANCMAIAAREAEAGDSRDIARELKLLSGPLPPALSPLGGEREGPADPRIKSGEEGERPAAEDGSVELARRFARELRIGAFENSPAREGAARAILWRMTIARLRLSNPRFLAANGFT